MAGSDGRRRVSVVSEALWRLLSFRMAVEDVVPEVRAEVARLTTTDRALIRSSFEKMMNGVPNYALALFIRLFAEHPEYKNIWPQFRAVADSALISSPLLKNHAFVYMDGLKDIVNSMEDDDYLCRKCKGIAVSHTRWSIYKHHIQAMIPELLGVMEKCTGPLTADEKLAWTKLYDIIGNLIDFYKKNNNKK